MTRIVNGHDQDVLPAQCPHPKCQEKYGKKEVTVGTLGTTLLDAAQSEIQKRILKEFRDKLALSENSAKSNKSQISAYERYSADYEKNAKTLRDKQPALDAAVEASRTALAALESAFAVVKTGPLQKYAGKRFHLDSKSGGKGHFMVVDTNGKLKCSCTAAAFDNDCWATKHIGANLTRGDSNSWAYLNGDKNFDARVRPYSTYFRVPGYSARPYSRYARLS